LQIAEVKTAEDAEGIHRRDILTTESTGEHRGRPGTAKRYVQGTIQTRHCY